MTKMLVSPELNAYAERFTTPEIPALQALREETEGGVARPHMLSGHLQGSFLTLISKMLQPRRILEIGTYTGYSAICLAQGLQEDGWLDTIELDERLKDIAARHFQESGLGNKIRPHFGKAMDCLEKLEGPYDLVFIDADKKSYERYYDFIFGKIPVGGVIIADNVLFNGEVLLPEEQQGPFAKAMHAFNEKVIIDTRVETVLLPLRDGITIVRKISE